VVVPSRGRAERLRLLLGDLAAQTLKRERFEVIVVHDYPEEELPAAGAGVRFVHSPAAPQGDAAHRRNLGWRTARAPLIAFTDDDCRPEPGWLAALLGAARAHPGAIVQGSIRPDPREADALRAPIVRTLTQTPPHWHAQTANVLYEREMLERLGGLDERLDAGEDVDLAARARAAGAPLVPAPDALVHHEVRAMSALELVRENRRWESLVLVVKHNPELRRFLPLRAFWSLDHLYAVLAAAGVLAAPRRPTALALCVPFYALERKRHGTRPGDRLLALRQMPVRCAVRLAEVGTFARGSLRHRTLVL
jgi:GT2 family glycosyltransferase